MSRVTEDISNTIITSYEFPIDGCKVYKYGNVICVEYLRFLNVIATSTSSVYVAKINDLYKPATTVALRFNYKLDDDPIVYTGYLQGNCYFTVWPDNLNSTTPKNITIPLFTYITA